MTFTCSTCSEQHDLDDISFGADAPAQWRILSEDERSRSELTPDQCVIESNDGRHFFLRASLEIPISGTDRFFSWGVWVSLSERSFLEVSDHWEDVERVKIGPHFGWLCTAIPEYPDTMFLKTMLHQQPVGLRPHVELEPSDHPLSLHQQHGIERAELERLVVRLLHDA